MEKSLGDMMPVGACGICCDVCLLRALGTCSTCGPGGSQEAKEKLLAQTRLLGGTCRILQCATQKGIGYCMYECFEFPCENFRDYPYSQSFLDMQKRRRIGHLYILDPNRNQITIPESLWKDLEEIPVEDLAKRTLFQITGPKQLTAKSLGKELLVDLKRKSISFIKGSARPSPLFEVVLLSHLVSSKGGPFKDTLIGLKDIRGSQFFGGTHQLDLRPLKRFFDNNMIQIDTLRERLSAEVVAMGDLGLKFYLFPRVPIWLVYWKGDEEFDSEINFLFDESIQDQIPVDALWGAIHILMEAIYHAHLPFSSSLH